MLFAAVFGRTHSKKGIVTLLGSLRRGYRMAQRDREGTAISTANGHADGAFLRDALATKMTPEDASKAQQREQTCLASHYKDCD